MNTPTLSNLSDLPELLIPLDAWEEQLDTHLHRLDPFFARSEAREQAKAYLKGLLSPVERKNGWQLAEHLGHRNPYRVQHVLDRAVWDADKVREDVSRFIVEHLGDPEGIGVLDESGFLKKGIHSVGVARQYCGTAGRVENCQVGVFLGYASPKGHTLLDRELYLPVEWVVEQARRDAAKVPPNVDFETKPELAQQMLKRAWAAGVPLAFVTADTVYGQDKRLRACLEDHRQAYVLAVPCDHRVSLEHSRLRVDRRVQRLPASAWQTLSCGAGSKGERLYDWACQPLDAPDVAGFGLWLLARRSLSDPTEVAYYQVFAPSDTPLARMVQVAGTRWTV